MPSRYRILFVLWAILAFGCAHEEPKNEIIIGLNPAERSENVQRNAEVLARMIGERAGMRVKIFVAQDYSGLVEALRSRTIDFAFFAPVSYVFAERLADARVLLKAERKGRPYYFGCIITNADSSYRTLADLKGRDIAWVDPTSASGHLFPKAALIESGINPAEYFGRETFAGTHDAVLLSVINGTIAAGATFANDSAGMSGSWTQLGDGAFAGKVRPIFFSRPIPGDNIATTQFMLDQYPQIVEKVKSAVLNITDTDSGKKMMQQMYHVDAMVPATSTDYDPVRNAADLLGLDITGRVASGTDSSSNARVRNRQTADERNEIISIIVLGLGLLGGLSFLVVQTMRQRRKGRGEIASAHAAAVPASPAGTQAQFILRDISVMYRDTNQKEVQALRDVDLDIYAGEFIAIIGLSGAGKSTLLRCLNRMNEPSAGSILFEGKDITHARGRELMELRRRIGFIFQQFNLVRNLTALKNVLAGRLGYMSWLDSMLGRFPRRDRELALHYLHEVGLADKIHARVDRISGGQQQRVAIARALAQEPSVILADEPMASLDPKLSEVVLDLLQRFNRKDHITIIVNLHVLELARKYASRIIALRKGEVMFDGSTAELTEEVVEEIYRTESA